MRTSSQLKNTDFCHNSNTVNLSNTQQAFIRAYVQRDIVMRSIQGETIPDIRTELDSLLKDKKALFENYVQRKNFLDIATTRMQKFITYQLNRPGTTNFLTNENDKVVSIDGEDIKVLADFIYVENDNAFVTKVKTGRASPLAITNIKASNEPYALALLGQKLYPNKNIIVSYQFLADATADAERQNMLRPYNYRDAKSFETFFDSEKFEKYESQLESAKSSGCSPEDCAGCSRNNICNFEEPPISTGVARQIKPLSEIRLTSVQNAIVNFDDGIARVNAGPGSGKTLVVAMRITKLIQNGVDPSKICSITFTKTGAEEMTGRTINYLAGQGALVDPDRITSTTINAFCQMIVDDHYEMLGYTQSPRVIPEEVNSGIINRILSVYPELQEWNYTFTSNAKYARRTRTKSALESAKSIIHDINKNGYTLMNNPYGDQYSISSLSYIFQMVDDYNTQLKQRCLYNYDDQLKSVFKLLEIEPNLFNEYGFEHIIVDEFQDTDLDQITLLQKMIETDNFKSFMAVGDDSQAIYGFRDTSPEYIINFDKYFGTFSDFNLLENHRSKSHIIDYANKINELSDERVEKDLIATREEGSIPRVEGFYTSAKEYQFIAQDIADRIARGQEASTIAVLTSDKFEIAAIASELTKLGIPSIAMNPIPFVQNSRVKALCSFYDSFVNNSTKGLLEYQNAILHGALKGKSDIELEEIIAEKQEELANIPKTVNKFRELAKALDENEVDECYQEFLTRIEYCNSMDELNEFFNDFNLYGQNSAAKREGHYDGVCLITVHSAKGSEWDTTYLTLSKFDSKKYHTNPNRWHSEINESYRKWFVGATRAKDDLIITGTYTLNSAADIIKNGPVLNNYLMKTYQMLDKVYGYNTGSLLAEIAAENEQTGPEL